MGVATIECIMYVDIAEFHGALTSSLYTLLISVGYL